MDVDNMLSNKVLSIFKKNGSDKDRFGTHVILKDFFSNWNAMNWKFPVCRSQT